MAGRQRAYVIGHLEGEFTEGKKIVEIIPSCWLDPDDNEKSYFYPPKSDWPKVEKWAQQQQPPMKDWVKSSNLNILAEADDYKQALTRLQRSYQQKEHIASSDIEQEERSKVVVLPKKKARSLLGKSESLSQPLSTIPEVQNSENSSEGKRNKNSKPRSSPSRNDSIASPAQKTASSKGSDTDEVSLSDRGTPHRSTDDNSRDSQKTPPLEKPYARGNSGTRPKQLHINRSFSKRNSRITRPRPVTTDSDSETEEQSHLSATLNEKQMKNSKLKEWPSHHSSSLARTGESPMHPKNGKGKIAESRKHHYDSSSSHFDLENPSKRASDLDNAGKKMQNNNEHHRNNMRNEESLGPHSQAIVDCITEEIEKTENKILQKIGKTLRSLQYDFKQAITTIQNTVADMNLASAGDTQPLNAVRTRAVLRTDFPIQTHEEFLKLEESLKLSNEGQKDDSGKMIEYSGLEKQSALISMFRGLLDTNDTWKDCVKKIISKVMSKEVQIMYSGKGRQTSFSKKSDFSSTSTYKCLEDLLMKKFPSADMNIIQYVGNYLSQSNKAAKKKQT